VQRTSLRSGSSFRTLGKAPFDPCTDPAAYVDPERGACAGTLVLPNTDPDINKVAVYGLRHFGGPTIVIARDPNPPGGTRGPDPKPGPPT
jgi:hypothetical protein